LMVKNAIEIDKLINAKQWTKPSTYYKKVRKVFSPTKFYFLDCS
jgi:hypothetical protein